VIILELAAIEASSAVTKNKNNDINCERSCRGELSLPYVVDNKLVHCEKEDEKKK
jgi:hypothetical protein